MRYAISLCMALLAFTALTCSDEDSHDEPPAYVVGQPCPDHITYDGICDGNTVVFCNNGVVETKNCPTRCMVKKAYIEPFAECYYECGDIDYRGKCADGGVNFCHETEGLIHLTCDSGQTCDLKGDIYACI